MYGFHVEVALPLTALSVTYAVFFSSAHFFSSLGLLTLSFSPCLFASLILSLLLITLPLLLSLLSLSLPTSLHLSSSPLSLPPSASVYRGEEEEEEDGCLVGVANSAQQSQMSGQEALSRMKVGTRVVRGQDWKWGDQV